MFLSFLLPLFYLFLFAQAGRKGKNKPSAAALSASTTSSTIPVTSTSSAVSTTYAVSTNSAASTDDSPSPASSSDPATPGSPVSLSASSYDDPSDSELIDEPHSQIHEFIEEPHPHHGITCTTRPDLPVLNRPDCVSSAGMIHAPRSRGSGLAIPPTARASAFRFSSSIAKCELFVTASLVPARSRVDIVQLWEPTTIEWIQIWVHVRMAAEMLIERCTERRGASAEELRRVQGGRGGSTSLLLDPHRLSDRMLAGDDSREEQPPGIRLNILLNDGKELAGVRDYRGSANTVIVPLVDGTIT
ncbi:hypothetical protein MMC11_002354 [Xylographa trunciseda]|nr:hypothetical protein [Xylographa trunciseda]